MINKVLIILGSGKAQIPIIETAKKLNYYVIGIDRNPESIGFKIVDKKIIVSTYDSNGVVNKLIELKDKYSYHYVGVIARTSGPALYTAAAISEKFGLPGLTAEIVPLATEKSTFRKFCHENNIPVPTGEKVNPTNYIETNCNFPLIIKPDLPIVGKEAVKFIKNKSDLGKAVESAQVASYNGLVELEEFIEGFDIGCLFKVNNTKASVVAIWDELVGIKNDGSILGCGVSVPSVIMGTEVEQKVINIVKDFAKSLSSGLEAVLILAFRINLNGDPYAIELHADLGGDLIADDLFPASDPHYDYFKLCIQVATLNKINKTPNFSPSAIIYKNLFNYQKPKERTTHLLKSFSNSNLHNKIKEKLIKNKNEFLFTPDHFNIISQIKENRNRSISEYKN